MLKNVQFYHNDHINSKDKLCGFVIYCDPPYKNTKQYSNSSSFNYITFLSIVKEWSKTNIVIVSEMQAPVDFVCIWEKDVSRSIKSTDKSFSTEKLFVYKYGLYEEMILRKDWWCKMLEGAKLAGGNPKNDRVENDYYATNPKAVIDILDLLKFNDNLSILEPCAGGGHILDVLNEYFPLSRIEAYDISDRGREDIITGIDFLTHDFNNKYDIIITNPPYSLGKEFVEKSMELLNDNGNCIMFLKIQFLEGEKRREMFSNYPPKYVYVYTSRMATWNSGLEKDPSTGKKWATTMCHAWFVWEKGNTNEPIIRWI